MNMLLYQILTFAKHWYTYKKNHTRKSKLKLLIPIRNEKYELLD